MIRPNTTSRPTPRRSLLLPGILLLGCGAIPGQTPRDASGELRVSRQVTLERQLLTGELVAERSIEITVPDVGIRPLEIRWMVENGATVAANDRLFELDNSDLASRLEDRNVEVLEARAKIASAEAEASTKISDAAFELEKSRAELAKARIDASIPAGLRSTEEYQRLQLELQKAERRVADAERRLATARATSGAETEKQRLQLGRQEAALRQVEGGIARLAIAAPLAGVVLIDRSWEVDRPFEVGDVVYPGHRLAELPDLASLVARARLFDVDDGRVLSGMLAIVELDAHPGVDSGVVRTVDRIAFERDSDSSSRVFWVTVDLSSVDPERMRAGMSVKVTVNRYSPAADAQAETLVAPRASLDLSDIDAPRARLADGTWRAVELGPCSPLHCVIADGLEEGQALRRASAEGEDSGS